MELTEIVYRYAEALTAIDGWTHQPRKNQRTRSQYLPGLKSMTETETVAAVHDWWDATYPIEARPPNGHVAGVPYPGIPRAKCDHVLTTDGDTSWPEWAIEVKNITLVGNNGKRNDFPTAKMLSPYLKDRSLLHDAYRLRENPLARRLAVIGYAFGYDSSTCAKARSLHPRSSAEIANIEEVCRTNGGDLTVDRLVKLMNGILSVRGLVIGSEVEAPFEAWRHPCGGRGKVFGWELENPAQQTTDPRHPFS